MESTEMQTNDVHENESGDELTPRQAKFVDALLAGSNVGIAARTAGVAQVTASRWQKLPVVKQALRQARQSMFEDRLSAIKDAVPTAIDVLLKHMRDKDTRPYVQVAAASKILDLAVEIFRMTEMEEIRAKIEQFEQTMKQQGSR